MIRFYTAFFLFLLSLVSVFAQSNFTAGGELRYRFQVDGKDFNSDTRNFTFNELRSRLNLAFTPQDELQVFLQVQDARNFGDETNTLTDGIADNLDLHQAWFRLSNIFKTPISLKAGRFEAAFGNERLIGSVGWHNIGRSFDGVMLNFSNEMVNADLFNFKESELKAFGETGDKNVIGIYANIKTIPGLKADVFSIWQRTLGPGMLSRLTNGAWAKGQFGAFWAEAEMAFQSGLIDKNTDIQAYLFALNGGMKFEGAHSPWVSAGIDLLSGDDDPADGKLKVFNTLYATNHKFYGFMDYFLDIPAHTGNSGLRDLHLKAGLKASESLYADLALHQFDRAVKLGDSDSFGREADLTLKYQYLPSTTFIGGGSLFSSANSDLDYSTWFYLMTVIKF